MRAHAAHRHGLLNPSALRSSEVMLYGGLVIGTVLDAVQDSKAKRDEADKARARNERPTEICVTISAIGDFLLF